MDDEEGSIFKVIAKLLDLRETVLVTESWKDLKVPLMPLVRGVVVARPFPIWASIILLFFFFLNVLRRVLLRFDVR